MRIKRFIASDMRTALRMIRDEQGADAVILSNRTIEGGAIEVVAATDYDEALVHQALRAAAPGIEPVHAPIKLDVPTIVSAAPVANVTVAAPAQTTDPHAAFVPAVSLPMTPVPNAQALKTGSRESLISRARSAFRFGAAATNAQAIGEIASASVPSQFEHLMAAINTSNISTTTAATTAVSINNENADIDFEPVVNIKPQIPAAPDTNDDIIVPVRPQLRVVARATDPDPSIIAMRGEIASMRELIERQMGQLTLERLRGSSARATAYEALISYGCEDSLAQAVAAQIDPHTPTTDIHTAMLAELARMIDVTRDEPLDEGGVIALIGPTGAGKTTTAAKLAARYAARHSARDVALVTTDSDRPGASEQLHAHGRRLGITVCDANGPQGWDETFAHLNDYPLVLVDTAGSAARDRIVLNQMLKLRTSHRVRSLLVLPANAHPHDMGEVIRRHASAAPEGVVLTKLDETGRLGSALSVIVRNNLPLAYITAGQNVPSDIQAADTHRLVQMFGRSHEVADDSAAIEETRHAVA